jgi:hypothetical protein
VSAYAASDAGRSFNIGVVLRIHADVDTHLAVGTAIAAGNTHIILDGNAEASEFLDQTHQSRQGAEETTPDSIPQ